MGEKIFLTAKYDSIFKSIFCDEDNPKLLIKLLENILKREITSIKFLNNELKIHQKEERAKRVDSIVLINGNIYVHIEVNSSYKKEITYRNLIFFYSIIVSKTIKNENYNLDDEFIHIDFTYGLSKKYSEQEEYKEMNKTAKIVRTKNIKEIEFNMDKIKQFWYNEDKEKLDKYKYLVMQDLEKEQLEKLNKMYEGDEVLMDYYERLKKLNENDRFDSLLTPEEEEIFWRNTERNIGEKIGEKRGEKRGLELGEKRGEKRGKIEGQKIAENNVARKMLKEGLDINLIARVTNLSKQQIASLR